MSASASIWHVARAVLVLCGLGAASAWALTAPPKAAQTLEKDADRMTLTTDAGDSALFELRDLAPGRVETRCVTVTLSGPSPAMVRLGATVAGSGLDAHLRTTIDVGSGGRFGDCRGFAGRRLFRGTLAALTGLRDRRQPAVALRSSDKRTFRVTVALEDAAHAASRRAEARFSWRADAIDQPTALGDAPSPADSAPIPATGPQPSTPVPAGETPPTTPVTGASLPDVTAGALPTAARPADPSAAATSRSSYGAGREGQASPVDPRQRPAGSSGAPRVAGRPDVHPAGDRGHAGPRRPGQADRGPRAQVAKLLRAAERLAAPVAERSAFPLLLIVVVGLFLLVQGRIDRRDPKLALAPLRAEPDLEFDNGGTA